nr:immunoglobulin light chain junction region [Macaca mulatta]MOX28104.1 immunoglobulin light chain junction region [Macaca mulatta]MOX28127.1 immunoglobulin light chain junction region [Macaca mulatta]MOX28131.1 immunoglobulin light chain junction region [Macaca mulatta]MOX28135.1 immunoglobulin light chain junction region [Macaca mulatta]
DYYCEVYDSSTNILF